MLLLLLSNASAAISNLISWHVIGCCQDFMTPQHISRRLTSNVIQAFSRAVHAELLYNAAIEATRTADQGSSVPSPIKKYWVTDGGRKLRNENTVRRQVSKLLEDNYSAIHAHVH